MIVDGHQIRAARVAIKLTGEKLAWMAKINKMTLTRLENGGRSKPETIAKVQGVLERAGVVFERDGFGRPSIRWPAQQRIAA